MIRKKRNTSLKNKVMRVIRPRSVHFQYNKQSSQRFGLLAVSSVIVLTTVVSSFQASSRVEAGAGPIEHYSARMVAQDTDTTANNWEAVVGATADAGTTQGTNGFIAGSNFNTDDRYLLMVWAEFNGASNAMQVGVRVTEGGTAFTESTTLEEVDVTGAAYKTPYFWFTVWTPSGDDLEVEYFGSTTNQRRIEDITMIAINAEDLIANGDLYYDIDTSPSDTTLDSTATAKVGVSWAPEHSADTWWTMGYLKGDTETVGTVDLEYQLNIDSGTIRSAASVPGEDLTDTPLRGIGWVDSYDNSTHTADLEVSEESADMEWDAAGIFALRLDTFEDFSVDSVHTGETTFDSNWTEVMGVDPTVTTQEDWLLAAGGIADDDGLRVSCRMQEGGTNVTDETGGWHFQNTDRMPMTLADVQIDYPTSGGDVDVDCHRTQGVTTTILDDSWLVAFSMELADPVTESLILAQEDYIFENDDQDGATDATAQAGSQFSSPQTLSSVNLGERTNLRVHLRNTGTAGILPSDEIALFYDKNDGFWSQVQDNAPVGTTPSGSEDCNGFDGVGGSTTWFCDTVIDGNVAFDYYSSATGINPVTGAPWIVSKDNGNNNLLIARYVGSGGDCDAYQGTIGSDAWQCEVLVDGDNSNDFEQAEIAFTDDGLPWIAFNNAEGTADDLAVASYVGSGGDCDGFDSTGGSDAWDCTQVFDGADNEDAREIDIAIAPDGNPWVVLADIETGGDDVVVAEHVGDGTGDCDTFDSGGSTDWECTRLFEGGETDGGDMGDGREVEIAFDNGGIPWVAFIDEETSDSNIIAATYVSSGGDCDTLLDNGGSDAWDCEIVYDGDTGNSGSNYEGRSLSLAIAPNGEPWMSFFGRESDANSELVVVNRVGTAGQNCDGFDGTGGSDTWNCANVWSGDHIWDGEWSDISFDPSGAAVVVFSQQEGSAQDDLYFARYVGSGGNCDTEDDLMGGTTAWECEEIFEDSQTIGVGRPSISYGPDGNAWIAFQNDEASGDDLVVAWTDFGGEIQLAPSQQFSNNDSLTESHADMTAPTDTTGRDTADCTNSGGWVDGKYYATKTGSGLTIPAGNSTARCTEVMWTLDTSQATAGDTYRFVVAVKGSWSIGDSVWTGPTTIDEYPELSIAGGVDQVLRYSKDLADSTADCEGFDGSGGSTDWTCEVLIDGNNNQDYRYNKSIDFSPDGVPFVASASYNATLNTTGTNLVVAEFVGSGGNCDGYDDTGGSDAWECTVVIDGNSTEDSRYHSGLQFGPDGVARIVVPNTNSGGTATDLVYVEHVGSGGNCDGFDDLGGSDAWQCTTVIEGDSSLDFQRYAGLAVSPSGVPHIVARNYSSTLNTTGSDLIVARFIGSGGNCDGFVGTGGSDAWQCEIVIDGDNTGDFISNSLAFTDDGRAYVAAKNHNETLNTTGSNLVVAERVGSGGNCDGFDDLGGSDAWQCTTVIDGEDANDYGASEIAIGPNNTPYVVSYSYAETLNTTGTNFVVANFVGSGGNCDGFDDTGGSDAWDCTTIVDGDETDAGEPDIVFGPDGEPAIAFPVFHSTTSADLVFARRVGSGGNCDGFDDTGGSDAWQCTTVIDGTDDFSYQKAAIAFNKSGVPYVATETYSSSLNTSGTNLVLANMTHSAYPLSRASTNIPGVGNASSGDYQYLLTHGYSDYDQSGFSCSGNSDYTGYCGLTADNGDYDSIVAGNASQSPVYALATRFDANAELPSIEWIGNTNLAPSASGTDGDIVIEAYRFGTTNAWEEVARDSTSTGCLTENCALSGIPSGTASEYYETIDGEYWMYIRVYQVTDSSTTITFKVDGFAARQTASALSSGSFFRGGSEVPLNVLR